MPTGKNTPFNVTILGLLLVFCLFAEASPHAASFGTPVVTHLTFHLFHANIFHLAANALCIALMRPSPRDLMYAYPVAVAASWAAVSPAVGFSAILYAYMGLNAMKWKICRKDWISFGVANAITAVIPGIAFMMHLAAFGLGLLLSYVVKKTNEHR